MSQVKADSITEHTSGAGVSTPVLIHAGAGINFGAQTLSHYEEGVWTPRIFGSTTAGVQTYAAQIGAFVRVGRIVMLNAKIVLTTKDAAMAGDVTIDGLPFTSNASLGDAVVTAGYIQFITFAAGYTQLCGLIPNNTSQIRLRQTGSNIVAQVVDATAISGTMQITLSAIYNI